MIFLYIFYIFDIFQKIKISNNLYNNGCNTLMQYLMTISYQSFVPYRTLKLFRRTILRYVHLMA